MHVCVHWKETSLGMNVKIDTSIRGPSSAKVASEGLSSIQEVGSDQLLQWRGYTGWRWVDTEEDDKGPSIFCWTHSTAQEGLENGRMDWHSPNLFVSPG